MDITSIIATNALAVGVVGFLLKLWVDKRLSHSLEKELEKFKLSLAKEVSLYSIQNEWNHTKKMELLGKLYEKMVDADFELKAFLLNIKVKKKDLIEEHAHKFCEKYLELNSLLYKNELFLEQSLVDDVRKIYEPYFEVVKESLEGDFDYEGFGMGLPELMEEVIDVGDTPRKRVVEKFRKSAGIDA